MLLDRYDDLLPHIARKPRYGGGPSPLRSPSVLAYACRLLRAGWTIDYVTRKIDYGNIPAFSDAFLKVVGVRPSVYRAFHGVIVRRVQGGRCLRPRKTWRASDLRRRKRGRPRHVQVAAPREGFI